MIELALTAEALAGAAVPSAAWLATSLAAPALAAQPELAASAIESQSAALAIPAEAVPDAGPDAIGAVTADPAGRLNGTIKRVLGAAGARVLIVPARQDGEFGLWQVEAGQAEVRPRSLLDRSRAVADVRLDAARATRLEADAAQVLASAAVRAAVLVAADTLGASQAMLDLVVEYSAQRKQFGVPIGSFQAVKHAAATMLVGIEAARSIVYFAAASVEAGGTESPLHAAAAKAQVTAEGALAADSALTLHGAIGYTWEHDLHLFYQRTKLNRALFGAPEIWNERIAAGLALAPA